MLIGDGLAVDDKRSFRVIAQRMKGAVRIGRNAGCGVGDERTERRADTLARNTLDLFQRHGHTGRSRWIERVRVCGDIHGICNPARRKVQSQPKRSSGIRDIFGNQGEAVRLCRQPILPGTELQEREPALGVSMSHAYGLRLLENQRQCRVRKYVPRAVRDRSGDLDAAAAL